MATSVFCSLSAALAVVSLLLTACSGNEDPAFSSAPQEAAARQAFTGQVVTHSGALSRSQPLVASSRRSLGFGQVIFTIASINGQSKVAAAPSGGAVTPDEFLDWAERRYPETFPGHQPTQSITLDGNSDGRLETITYRYWPETGNYVGIQTAGDDVGGIYLYGAYVGNVLTRYAHTDELISDPSVKCDIKPDLCRPRVTSVTPAAGATGIEIKDVTIAVNFDREIVCPPGPITGNFGVVVGTLSCSNRSQKGIVTITATTLPDNSQITASLSGFRGAEGEVEMLPYTWSFTTRKGIVTVLETKVLSANAWAFANGTSEAASIIDPVTSTVKRVKFAAVPGYLIPSQIAVDSKNGIGYIGAEHTTFVLHRFDVKTGQSLSSIVIEPENWGRAHAIHGIAVIEALSSVYIVTGRWGIQHLYGSRNRLIGFSADGTQIFTSPTDFVAGPDQTPMKIVYSKNRDKFYVLAAAENGLIIESNGSGMRDGYRAGTVGTLTEIDATTHVKGRTWNNIGSVALDMAFVENETKLLIVVAGDKKRVTVDLASGTVTSTDWSALFGQYSYPVSILPDEEKGVYYVSDWYDSVRVMSLSTHQEVDRIALDGGTPRGMKIVSGDLWVARPREAVWYGSQKIYVIDRNKRAIKRSIVAGEDPYNLAVYERTEIR